MDDQPTIVAKLDELIEATRAQQAVWLDATAVAARICRNRRYVLERLAPRPDFPKRHRGRWRASEIDAWMEADEASRAA